MSGFVKIYGGILESSIWMTTSDTRVVWITMLAMADAGGRVAASVGGLAHRARVSREACETALATLSAPDPDDRSGVDEGRRLRPVQGGWLIVNHGRYREMRTLHQEQVAVRVARHRAKRKAEEDAARAQAELPMPGGVTPGNDVTPEAEADPEQEHRSGAVTVTRPRRAPGPVYDLVENYRRTHAEAHPGGAISLDGPDWAAAKRMLSTCRPATIEAAVWLATLRDDLLPRFVRSRNRFVVENGWRLRDMPGQLTALLRELAAARPAAQDRVCAECKQPMTGASRRSPIGGVHPACFAATEA